MSEDRTNPTVKSADRALAVVEYVAGRGSASFTEILDGLRLPRSSAHGLLNTLCSAGWLDHNPANRQYSLGLRAWQVGQMYTGHQTLANVAKPVMDRLKYWRHASTDKNWLKSGQEQAKLPLATWWYGTPKLIVRGSSRMTARASETLTCS